MFDRSDIALRHLDFFFSLCVGGRAVTGVQATPPETFLRPCDSGVAVVYWEDLLASFTMSVIDVTTSPLSSKTTEMLDMIFFGYQLAFSAL